MVEISLIMESEQYGCVHEKQRLALIKEIDELEEERIEMKTELEEIPQHLNNFKEFWESMSIPILC